MLTILATLVGAVASVVTLIFLLAGSANAKPAQLRLVKVLLAVTVLVGIGSVAGAIAAHDAAPGLAAWLGGAPALFAVVALRGVGEAGGLNQASDGEPAV